MYFRHKMGSITLKYYHPILKVGMADWKTVFECDENGQYPAQLLVELHRGALVYGKPSSDKRLAFQKLKNGWIKKTIHITLPDNSLPF
jgi:hypothetical protein